MWIGGSIRDFFGFSRREITGIRILFVCIAILLIVPAVVKRWAAGDAVIDDANRREIHAFLSALQAEERRSDDATHEIDVAYVDFDPNQLAHAGWRKLGFTERQARMIINYRKKGGRFRRKEDLKRIYSVSDADYARVEPYIVIADSESASNNVPSRKPRREPVREEGTPFVAGTNRFNTQSAVERDLPVINVEINSADSFMFQLLPGIGPAFASRIVRFRERLGGFHDASQLLDVYGMDSVRYEGFADLLEVDPSQVQRIAINRVGYDELGTHPLIGYKLARLIVRYREHHGPFQTVSDLLEMKVVDELFLRKIAPYLEF